MATETKEVQTAQAEVKKPLHMFFSTLRKALIWIRTRHTT